MKSFAMRGLLLLLVSPWCSAFVVPSSLARTSNVLLQVATSPEETATVPNKKFSCEVPPFTNIMAANRAEIAVRIMRAATELNAGTVAIYGHEDRYSQHRYVTLFLLSFGTR
jgi:hypothetical protein